MRRNFFFEREQEEAAAGCRLLGEEFGYTHVEYRHKKEEEE
jgi:hypothetical protein